MNVLGFSITRARRQHAVMTAPPESRGWLRIFDSYSGAWQQDSSLESESIVRQSAVFRCVCLVAGDVAKLNLRLMQLARGVWSETTNPAYSPLLRRQNPWQTRLEFFQYWLCSLLLDGNTYVLLRRDQRGIVTRATVLEPSLVTPLVSTEGDVFYRVEGGDAMTGAVGGTITIPARDIIHDKYVALNHPLIGNSPLQVAGAAATGNQKTLEHSKSFFTNRAMPGGVLEAPEGITQEQATQIRDNWQTFTETGAGKVAILENGLKFSPLAMKAVDSQLLETLKYNQEDIARAFGVPAWKIGAGTMPTANNAEISERAYYSQTLQLRIEAIELLLDHAMGLTDNSTLGVEFDLRGLLRMDTASRYRTYKEGVSAGILSPNEARAEEGLEPVSGGETPYLQQQNYSLAALAKRDAKDDPFETATPAAAPGKEPPLEGDDEVTAAELAAMIGEHM